MSFHRHRRRAQPLAWAEREYLQSRMGHTWVDAGSLSVRCTGCGKVQRRRVSRATAEQRKTRAAVLCPARKKPNRWKLHYSRWQDRQDRASARGPEPGSAAHVLSELQALTAAAKSLPQDVATWATHPVPRRYRRLLKRWWAFPRIPLEVARLSPTWDLPLTALGRGRAV